MVSGGTVTGDLSTLKGYLNTVSSEVSSLSGGWMGASHDSISSQVESFVSEILGVVSGQMESFATACDLYPQYEECKNNLANARSQYNAAPAEKKSTYSGRVSQYESQLQELKQKIEAALAGVGGSVIASSSSDASVAVDSTGGATASYGSFTRESFTASNGISIDYLIYRPSYNGSTDVSGLPVHMYMTGASMKSTGDHIMTDAGLGKLLNEKNITPSGIVIVPYVPSGVEYENKNYRKALAELPVAVCKQNNGDTNRISLSGHSYGAITAYNLVNENPGVFSAIVPVSGSKPPTEAFKNVKVWAFHGQQDNPGNNTDYRKAVKNVDAIQAMGGTATLHTYTDYPNCYHSHTHDYTFSNSFDDPDKDDQEEINPLEWAFKQRKDETVKA